MIIQMQATTVLTVINILLLMVILGLNLRCYKKVCAHYTVFLMVFAGLFLLENLVQGFFLITRMELYVPEVATHILVFTALETAAFISLLWMEWQ